MPWVSLEVASQASRACASRFKTSLREATCFSRAS
eukprot:CAMPEP_0183443592 /NCGR_PEP_ID=MMETSP0370-20130417/92329_1 /TAXON_ID=268820 /ORGANISM="Peridinium aciculiferum, Strain PAER-2" /LENGTH=34 /DNA_ID= /DNA_START= /DNA_END= /DNA_ORIENTATION=